MMNKISAQVELLTLKLAVSKTLHDYLLGSYFTILIDNILLAHIKENRLGAAWNHWLSELTPLDFDIKHQSEKLALLLMHYPTIPQS